MSWPRSGTDYLVGPEFVLAKCIGIYRLSKNFSDNFSREKEIAINCLKLERVDISIFICRAWMNIPFDFWKGLLRVTFN